MQNVAVVALYAVAGNPVPAFACAYTPEGRPLTMALSADLAPEYLTQASNFFSWLESRQPDALFVPSEDGRAAKMVVPSAAEFGFEPCEGSFLAPLDEAPVSTWAHWGLATQHQKALDAAVAEISDKDFEGLG